MTKSNRHKKLRKQDKAKTQLTGVKRLSKASNVVEPTLRVKKILIREQLKTGSLPPERGSVFSPAHLKHGTPSQSSTVGEGEEEEVTTRRKQSIQDLLASSNHHNTHMRKDAVLGMQEIASSQSNVLIRNLDKVLTRIVSLTSDQEGDIRKENLKLAEMVFSKINENQLRPFWSMIIAHLKCTLTHLIPHVRYSALAFIELLVEHYPALVTEASSLVLPSVLGLISAQKDPNDASAKLIQKQGATSRLKVEISGKHCDIKERLKVLRLLSKCINIASIDSHSSMKSRGQTIHKEPSEYLSLRYPFGYCWDQAHEMELVKDFPFLHGFNIDSVANRSYSTIVADPFSSVFSSDSNQTSANFWQDFVTWCISALIGTWVELKPSAMEGDNANARRGKKAKHLGFVHVGNDKDAASFGRQNGFHILNEDTVDNLLCVVTLFEQLLRGSKISTDSGSATGCNNNELNDESVKIIKKLHGPNISKYFFCLMPYVALQDSRRKDVAVINLKLFLIAGKLKIFDSVMKKKLQTFIQMVMERPIMDREQCQWILNIIGYATDTQQLLSTQFIIYASKMGHFDIVAEYLRNLIHPSIHASRNKSVQELMMSLQWNEIIPCLIQSWPASNTKVEDLLEVITFVSLRQLTELRSVLVKTIKRLKDLITSSKSSKIWDAAYRAFYYSNAESVFKAEFSTLCPSNLLYVNESNTNEMES